MTPETTGIIAISILLTLILLRVPIGVALWLCGVGGNLYFLGAESTFIQLQLVVWELNENFVMVTLPLFILMGQLAHHFGLGEDLYRCFGQWFGRLPGGMAATSIASAASFGAISGSSVATVGAIGKTLLPEMKRMGYDTGLSSGALASAGVLAILIPPSVPMVFYSAWTKTSLGDLFIAGLLPGLVLMLLFMLYVLGRCWLNPAMGPVQPAVSWRQKLRSLIYIAPVTAVLIGVLLTIYLGLATPTEAAAVGVAGIVLAGYIKQRGSVSGRLRTLRPGFATSLDHSLLLSVNLLLLLTGGLLFSRFMAYTQVTDALVATLAALELSAVLLLVALVFLYLLLGAILDTFGMIILTLPVVYPLVLEQGIDPIWFGVFIVMMIELALITPPIGLNVFVIQKMLPDIGAGKVFRGTLPFVMLTLVVVCFLISWPGLALWLPDLLVH